MEEISYEQFCQLFFGLSGFELAAYKRGETERRVREYAQRKSCATLAALWESLAHRPNSLQQFLDYLTINVTYFFRDPEQFHTLRQTVLPALLQRGRELFIWSAGCANGSEAYSLKMLLHTLAPTARSFFWATDIDRASLARARRGLFSAGDIQHVPAPLRERYFTPAGQEYRIDAQLRAGIDFQLHDLLCDPYPGQVDLILCRNVNIYLAQSAQQRVTRACYGALRTGGYLLVGNTERLDTGHLNGFASPAPHLYQKVR